MATLAAEQSSAVARAVGCDVTKESTTTANGLSNQGLGTGALGEDVALGGEGNGASIVGATVARGIAQPEEIGIGGDGCIDAAAGNRLKQQGWSSRAFGADVG